LGRDHLIVAIWWVLTMKIEINLKKYIKNRKYLVDVFLLLKKKIKVTFLNFITLNNLFTWCTSMQIKYILKSYKASKMEKWIVVVKINFSSVSQFLELFACHFYCLLWIFEHIVASRSQKWLPSLFFSRVEALWCRAWIS
jgi:hypothetical protein